MHTSRYRSLLSTKDVEDLRGVNPFIAEDLTQTILDVSVACILRGSRLGHTNRCIVAGNNLLDRIDHALQLSADEANADQAALRPNIEQSCSIFASLLLTKRHFVNGKPAAPAAASASKEATTALEYDPRFLVFEFVWNILLRKNQVRVLRRRRRRRREADPGRGTHW